MNTSYFSMEQYRILAWRQCDNFDDMVLRFRVKFCTIFRHMLLNYIISSSNRRNLMLALPQKTINCAVTRVR